MSYQWTVDDLAKWTKYMGFNNLKEINFLSGSNPVPNNGDMWLSGTDLIIRITGSNYKVNLTLAP